MLAVTAVALGPSASAHEHGTAFVQTYLVSDLPGMAQLTDPALVNPWGLGLGQRRRRDHALRDPGRRGRDEGGAGADTGNFVDVYTDFGQHRERFASRGPLNAPWAITVAPASFGRFAGDVLVGDFGDGRINAFDRRGHFEGPLRGADGKPLVIDGLWGLVPGTAATGGTDSLWFAAGLNHEADRLLGLIGPATS